MACANDCEDCQGGASCGGSPGKNGPPASRSCGGCSETGCDDCLVKMIGSSGFLPLSTGQRVRDDLASWMGSAQPFGPLLGPGRARMLGGVDPAALGFGKMAGVPTGRAGWREDGGAPTFGPPPPPAVDCSGVDAPPSGAFDWRALCGVDDPSAGCGAVGGGRQFCAINGAGAANPADSCVPYPPYIDPTAGEHPESASDGSLSVTYEGMEAAAAALYWEPLFADAVRYLNSNRVLIRWIICLYTNYYSTEMSSQACSDSAGWIDGMYSAIADPLLLVFTASDGYECAANNVTPMYAWPAVSSSSGRVIRVCLGTPFMRMLTTYAVGSSAVCDGSPTPQRECVAVEIAALLLHEYLHLLGWEGHSPNLPSCISNTFRWAMAQRYSLPECCRRFAYAANVEYQPYRGGDYAAWRTGPCSTMAANPKSPGPSVAHSAKDPCCS